MSGESEVVRLLRDLIRIDTSNPPGNERAAADYIAARAREEGLEPVVAEPEPGRASVVLRLAGDGSAPPLLLSAHLDVVPALEPGWTHPPFRADSADGCVWGRGAVDMKHMAAMSLSTLFELKRRGVALARDVIFAGVADEEAGGRLGAGHLVDHRRGLVQAEYALTEVGGMAMPTGHGAIVPVMVAEKGLVWLRLRAKGRAGHGSMPDPDSAVARLAQAVSRLSRKPLQYRLTPPVRSFFSALASLQPPAGRAAVLGLLSGATAPFALKMIPPERRRVFRAMLHDTAAVTCLAAGARVNVVPEEAVAEVDGRYLPGVTREEFIDEIRRAVGDLVELEVTQDQPPVETRPGTPLWDAIVEVMGRAVPGCRVAPYMITGFTDAKHYARAGIATYGFAPVKLKADEPFTALYHAVDERISIEGLEAGTSWLYQLVHDFCRR